MRNESPSAYLLWAVLSCIFLVFLILHLWAYDRFNCLRWNAGRQPGTFKRVMTYCYLGTVPLLVVFSTATAAIKFSEGFVALPSGSIVPKPLALWGSQNLRLLLPLYFVLSVAWSLELVTHLEELTFWLFLLHQGPKKREWFHSWEFKTWCLGSIIAVLGMPLTTLATRNMLDMCQTYIFLVGSSAGTTTTLCFLYVLFRFPTFVKRVKAGGAEPDVVVRLSTFYQLNQIRVMFRFLFTVPLLIVAIDALQPPFSVVIHPFALDFLLMVGGIGCFVSSAITLLVFFPRSFTHEAGYTARMHVPLNSRKVPSTTSFNHHERSSSPHVPKQPLGLAYSVPLTDSHQSFQHFDHPPYEASMYSSRGSVSQFTESRRSFDDDCNPLDNVIEAENEARTSRSTNRFLTCSASSILTRTPIIKSITPICSQFHISY
ncbi:hypothetical protein Agabi119p4_6531 [Agaricus bisporus var. burnettii]|uniref:Uncharacterized protein n=1 Tax=Agaricus bisporus var. burnettii TaxID=192524 RepID=A0A8H7EZR5_AGABI|nr:hypothetical protein Agabi119p4_6531 [Agaricus bisporus var. burnettii]